MVGNVASLSLAADLCDDEEENLREKGKGFRAANLCDDEEEHLREKGKVLRAMRLPPDDAYVNVNVNADALVRKKPREDACIAIRWRRMIGSTYHLRVVGGTPAGRTHATGYAQRPSYQQRPYQRSAATHRIAPSHRHSLSFGTSDPVYVSLVVPISAASALGSSILVSSYSTSILQPASIPAAERRQGRRAHLCHRYLYLQFSRLLAIHPDTRYPGIVRPTLLVCACGALH